MRLRVGIYDSFWEIPVETITDAPLEIITDLVKQEREMLASIFQNLDDETQNYLLEEEYRAATAISSLSFLENL